MQCMLCKYGCGKEARFQLKNGNFCCENSPNKCSELRKKNSNKQKISYNLNSARKSFHVKFKNCQYCKTDRSVAHFDEHEQCCYLNPTNMKLCPVCNKPIKDYKRTKTCSSLCSKVYFREMYRKFSRLNKKLHYRTICFDTSVKKCIICSESNIVTVHHYNGDHNDNSPVNLIPLCPTHHMYCHSKFYDLIKPQIEEYYYINSKK